jgi:hypothetical protein
MALPNHRDQDTVWEPLSGHSSQLELDIVVLFSLSGFFVAVFPLWHLGPAFYFW